MTVMSEQKLGFHSDWNQGSLKNSASVQFSSFCRWETKTMSFRFNLWPGNKIYMWSDAFIQFDLQDPRQRQGKCKKVLPMGPYWVDSWDSNPSLVHWGQKLYSYTFQDLVQVQDSYLMDVLLVFYILYLSHHTLKLENVRSAPHTNWNDRDTVDREGEGDK